MKLTITHISRMNTVNKPSKPSLDYNLGPGKSESATLRDGSIAGGTSSTAPSSDDLRTSMRSIYFRGFGIIYSRDFESSGSQSG